MMLSEDPSLSRDFEKIYTDNRVFQKLFEKAMLRWISGKFACDGVESWSGFRRRVNDALDAVMRAHGKGSTIAVFASGGSIASAVGRVLDLSDEMTLRLSWQIANASITRFNSMREDHALVVQLLCAPGDRGRRFPRNLSIKGDAMDFAISDK
jgi:broad specificity phosphatase PhoE